MTPRQCWVVTDPRTRSTVPSCEADYALGGGGSGAVVRVPGVSTSPGNGVPALGVRSASATTCAAIPPAAHGAVMLQLAGAHGRLQGV